jgi:hypothetical protein
MNLPRRKPRHCLLSLALAVLAPAILMLAGCAVLNVDVDVYKGPLANSQDIQTEQVAAIAMGAKPLLVTLRDQAECATADEKRLGWLRTNDWYKQYGYISADTGGKPHFTNDLAIRVNAILSMYEDRESGDAYPLVAKARQVVGECTKDFKILHRQTNDDVKAWKRMNLDARTNTPAQKQLVDDYRTFLIQSNVWRYETNVFLHAAAFDNFSKLEQYFGTFKETPSAAGANPCFFALQDQELLDLHAGLLFPGTNKTAMAERADFIGEVRKIAKSFTDSRAAMARLWRLDLGILALLDQAINRPAYMEQSMTLDPQARRPAKTQRQIEKAAELAVNIVQAEYLHGLLKAVNGQTNGMAGAVNSLRILLEEGALPPGFIMDKNPSDGDSAPERPLRDALRRALEAHPSSTALALVAADTYFIQDKWVKDTEAFKRSGMQTSHTNLVLDSNRQFGLAAGLTKEVNQALEANSWQDDLANIAQPTEGMAHGRVNDGVQTQIENYLEAAHSPSRTKDEVFRAREQLLDGLVAFGEKVKFIADSQALVSRRSGVQDWLTYSAEIVTFPLTKPLSLPVADFDDGFWSWWKGGINYSISRKGHEIFEQTDAYERAKPYTQVLQAVGNSIISLVNEIVERTTFDKNATNVIDPQWHAMTNAIKFLSQQASTKLQTGSSTLSMGDITNLASFAGKLQKPTNTVSQYLRSNLLVATQVAVDNYTTNSGTDAHLEQALIEDLNRLIQGGSIYEPAGFSNVTLSATTKALLGQNPQGADLALLNRTLLDDAYPDELSKNQAGQKTAGAGSGTSASVLFSNLDPPANKKEALDMLINALRDVQLSATATGETKIADQAKAAIDLANVYRADDVYIRPPSAYLRNSYPATSLQPNANIGWHNLLDRHAIRSMPVFGETIANWGLDVGTLQQIDKQYWQSINRVRVAAVGITSYAITKDDIGNWYVMSYTGDPSPIIEGAKSLTMYGAAASAATKGAQALNQAVQSATNAASQPALLDSQYTHFATNYLGETTNEAWRVVSFVKRMTNDLITSIGSTSPTKTATTNSTTTNVLPGSVTNVFKYYDRYLTNTVARLTNSLAKEDPAETIGKEIADTFDGVKSFQTRLVGDLDASLKQSVSNVIDEDLSDLISDRLKTVKQYESAFQVLSESVAK